MSDKQTQKKAYEELMYRKAKEEYTRRQSTPVQQTQPQQPQQPTEKSFGSKALSFGNEMAKGFVKTGIRLATANPIADLALKATGKEEMNLPWVGNVKTYSKDIRDTGADVLAGRKRARALVGAVAEPVIDVASLMAGGGVVGQGVKQGGKQLLKQAVVQGGKYGAGYGAVQGMKSDKDWSGVAVDTGTGAVGGAVLGGGLHGAGRLASEFMPKVMPKVETGMTEQIARRKLAELQMQKLQGALQKERPQATPYVSGVRGKSKGMTPVQEGGKTIDDIAKASGMSFDEWVKGQEIKKDYVSEVKQTTGGDIAKVGTYGEAGSAKTSARRKLAGDITAKEIEIAKRDQVIFDANKNKTTEQLQKEIIDSKNFAEQNNSSYSRSIKVKEDILETRSQLKAEWDKLSQPQGMKTVNAETPSLSPLHAEAKKYATEEEFLKGQGTPVYHSTNAEIGSFSDKFNPERPTQFTTDKTLFRGKGKNQYEVFVDVKKPYKKSIGETVNIGDLKKRGYDGVINSTGKIIIPFNPSQIITKSQLSAIYKQAKETSKKSIPTIQNGSPIPQYSFQGETTTPKFNYQRFIDESMGINQRPVKNGALDRQILEAEKQAQNPTNFINDIPDGAGRVGNNPLTAVVRGGERSLQNEGIAGQELLNRMKKVNLEGDLQAGQWKGEVNRLIQGLSPEELTNVTGVLEGKAKPMSDRVVSVSGELRGLLDKIQGIAKDTGIDVGYRENYYPRIYEWGEMTKKGRQEELAKHMVDTGQAGNRVEAEKFLKEFIFKNRERKAGNLEYERMFDLPGYEMNPEKAISMYAEMASRRISEAKNFGKKDEVANALIEKIARGGGDAVEAQRVFDYMYKGEPKNAIAGALLQYNTITKLSLSFLSNLTQNANTMAKAGIVNTVKGMGQALAQGYKAVKNQKYDDIAYLANALDDVVAKQEMGLMDPNRLTQGVMYLFQKVERFNRRTSANAGAYRAEQLLKVLQENPESAFAARQMKSLGIDIRDVLDGKLTQEQLLTAANRMTEATQFRVNALNVPSLWRTPAGKVLSQYKSFSFMQTKFLRDEIVKEATRGNFAPLVRFFPLAVMASMAQQGVRNYISNADAGKKPGTEGEKDSPFRKWDTYRKAIGDIPSDIAAQMAYAMDKKDKWYTNWMDNAKNFSSPFVGPSVGDALQLGSALTKADNITADNEFMYKDRPDKQQDPYLDAKRFAVSKIPFVGRRIQNTNFNYYQHGGFSTLAKQAEALMKEGIREGNLSKIQEAAQLDPYLNDRDALKRLQKEVIDESRTQEERDLIQKIKDWKKQNSNKPIF